MDSLVNFDGLGNVANNLIDKLANGIGWLVNKETPNKLATNTYIKAIQEKDYDPVIKAALISNARKIIKEYCNQNNIVNIAIQSLQCSSKPEIVEDDWLERFMDKARLVSLKEFQYIWGKILAKECNEPGSIPLVLLYTLEKMDREDAESFTALCKISVQLDGEYSPIIIGSRFDEYNSLIGLTYEKLVNLNSLGLIEMDLGVISSGYALTTEVSPAKVMYHDKVYELPEEKQIDVGNVIFTKSGQALCQSLVVDEVDGYWEKYCLPFWEEKKRTSRAKL